MYRNRMMGILMIVQGVLEGLMGLMLGAASRMAPQIAAKMKEMGFDLGGMEDHLSTIYLVLAALTSFSGVFHFVAGVRTLMYRNRMMGILSLIVGSGSMASCYCAPTNIGLLVYGLIVYLNRDVARAFVLGEEGYTTDEIQRMTGREDQHERGDDGWGDAPR